MMNQSAPRRGPRVPRLAIALGLGAVAAVVVYLYVGSVQQQAQEIQKKATETQATVVPRVAVLVAKTNLPAGQPLKADDFEVKNFAKEMVASTALKSPGEIGNRVLDAPLAANEQDKAECRPGDRRRSAARAAHKQVDQHPGQHAACRQPVRDPARAEIGRQRDRRHDDREEQRCNGHSVSQDARDVAEPAYCKAPGAC